VLSVAVTRSSERQRRLQPEVEQLGVGGVVVVLLGLGPRVLDLADLDLEAELLAGLLHLDRELTDREGLGELVVDPHLAGVSGVQQRQLDTGEGVADVEEPTRLAPGAVDRQRVSDDRLQAEPVERGPELLVVVEPREQSVVEQRLVGVDAVDDALVEVGRPESVDPGCEVDVGRVGDLAGVVPAVAASSGTAGCPCGPCARSR
jgi:hypothetical protein